MIRRLRAWWGAPLFTMPHRARERQIPMYSHPDCPPNVIYFLNPNTMIGPPLDGKFEGWY